MMRTIYNKSLAPILVIMLMAGMTDISVCQDAQSRVVRFKVSNIPDHDPPTINVMTPTVDEQMNGQTSNETVVLVGEVSDKSGIKFISVNDDVRPVNDAGIFTSSLKLVPGLNRIHLIAADTRDNLIEKQLSIYFTPPIVSLADKIRRGSRYYALIIGIDQYQDPNLPDLDNPIKDAEKLFRTLTTKYVFDESNMLLLRNPRRIEIVDALDYLSNVVTPEDNLLIFYAGHGNWDERADLGYWLPSDAYLSSSANWFRNSALVDYLKLIDSKHTLLITDACFSGSIFKSRSGFPQAERAYEVQYNLSSRKAMTSGNLTEVPDRSAFTKYLVERLDENEDLYMTSWELFGSMRNAVINNSDALPVYGVIQNVGDEGGEFIFLKRSEY